MRPNRNCRCNYIAFIKFLGKLAWPIECTKWEIGRITANMLKIFDKSFDLKDICVNLFIFLWKVSAILIMESYLNFE